MLLRSGKKKKTVIFKVRLNFKTVIVWDLSCVGWVKGHTESGKHDDVDGDNQTMTVVKPWNPV